MSSGLSVLFDGEILRLTLSQPEKSNSFGVMEAAALVSALRKHKTANAVVFTSRGSRFFCAGGDMQHYASLKSKGQGLLANRKISQALAQLAKFPAPTLAIVNGDCLGGGLEVMGAFDEIWAQPEIRFGFWQRRIGLSFGWGGFSFLSRRLSASSLRRLSLEAANISSLQAREIGLVDRVISRAYVDEALVAWLKLRQNLPLAPVGILKSLNLKNEAQLFSRLWYSKEHRHALEIFSKRRNSQ